jgi:hypothetical protein
LPEPLGPSKATTIISTAHRLVGAFYCVERDNCELPAWSMNAPTCT